MHCTSSPPLIYLSWFTCSPSPHAPFMHRGLLQVLCCRTKWFSGLSNPPSPALALCASIARRCPGCCAAEQGFSHCVETLLRHSANLNAADTAGVTALLAAAAAGHGATARLLLQRGSSPAAKDLVQHRWVGWWVLSPAQ